MALTYLGTVDDSVGQYPWGYAVDIDFVNRQLATAALAGDQIAINDGYLMLTPALWNAAQDHREDNRSSPLRELMWARFVKVLIRSSTSSLADIPERMAAENNASYMQLTSQPDWSARRRNLERLSEQLIAVDGFVPWPKGTVSPGFCRLMRQLHQKDPASLGLQHATHDDLLRTLDEWENLLGPEMRSPRDRWISAVRKIANSHNSRRSNADAQKVLLDLMYLANEAYHINFAACLAAEDRAVAVATRFSVAFAEYLHVDETTQSDWPRVPLLKLPDDFPIGDGKRLAEVVSPNSKLNDAKKRYLGSLDGYLAGNYRLDDLESSAQAYSELLSYHFYRDRDVKRWGYLLRAAPPLTAFIFSHAIGAGLAASAVIAVLSYLGGTFGLPSIVKLIEVRDRQFFQPPGYGAPDTPIVDKLMARRPLMSLSLKADAIKEHVSGLPQVTL